MLNIFRYLNIVWIRKKKEPKFHKKRGKEREAEKNGGGGKNKSKLAKQRKGEGEGEEMNAEM